MTNLRIDVFVILPHQGLISHECCNSTPPGLLLLGHSGQKVEDRPVAIISQMSDDENE